MPHVTQKHINTSRHTSKYVTARTTQRTGGTGEIKRDSQSAGDGGRKTAQDSQTATLSLAGPHNVGACRL